MTSAMRFSASASLMPIQQVDARAATRSRNDMAEPPHVHRGRCDRRTLWCRLLVSWPVRPVRGRPGFGRSGSSPNHDDQRVGVSYRASLQDHLEFAAVASLDDEQIRLAV